MLDKSIFILGSFVVSCSAKVSRFPHPGESLAASLVTIEAGGKGFNLAIGARRLGARVDGLLAVGNDAAAHFARPALARAFLSDTMLVVLPGATGAGIGFTDRSGETCLAVDPGVNGALSDQHVADAAARILSSGLVMAQFEISDAPIRAAFALARRAGIATLLNPSPFRPIAADILADTSILIVNETEADALASTIPGFDSDPTGTDRFVHRLAPALLSAGPDIVILTLGAAGALAVTRAGSVRQPGFAVAAIDTLGAGDAFAACLGVSLAAGLALPEAMRRAAAAGACATLRDGVFDALPDEAAISPMLSGEPV